VDILRTDPEPLRRLWRNTALLHEIVAEAGFAGHGSRTPIVPVVLGDATRCVSWAVGALREWGVYLSSVQTPAVAEGQARLRLCATAAQTPEQLARLREALLGLRAAEQAGILQPA
jgi:7-keto-8-aminopelargonate synthetase-like enzyme